MRDYDVGDIMYYDCDKVRRERTACVFRVTRVLSVGRIGVDNLYSGCCISACPSLPTDSRRDHFLFRGNLNDLYTIIFEREEEDE